MKCVTFLYPQTAVFNISSILNFCYQTTEEKNVPIVPLDILYITANGVNLNMLTSFLINDTLPSRY